MLLSLMSLSLPRGVYVSLSILGDFPRLDQETALLKKKYKQLNLPSFPNHSWLVDWLGETPPCLVQDTQDILVLYLHASLNAMAAADACWLTCSLHEPDQANPSQQRGGGPVPHQRLPHLYQSWRAPTHAAVFPARMHSRHAGHHDADWPE